MGTLLSKMKLLLVLLCCYKSAFPQAEDQSFFSKYHQSLMDEMGLIYNKPTCFTEEIGKFEDFEDNSVLWNLFHSLLLQWNSDNNKYIVFCALRAQFTASDSIGINSWFPGAITGVNHIHLGNIRASIMKNRYPDKDLPSVYPGWKKDLTWRKELKYYPEREAKEKFNADTAIVFDLRLEPHYAYKGEYTLARNLVLQKNHQGSVFITVFCKGDIEKEYWNQLEKMFNYGKKPIPRVVDPNVRDSVVVHFKGRRDD